MYLKEVDVENFKSFGKKYRFPFLQGFTAVTGPNGSGKSNISDAILFVLGPKSSKVIRAKKLTDLIFDGGKEKKPADYCKVSLKFDNTDRIIPIDEDEVELTRVVKISPSNRENYLSYFYVNGRVSSQSEFDDLLAYARILADGYNVVQQGDINKITSMGDIERRNLIESVAGITKFDSDIENAEQKKKDVEGNLERINIILNEIKLNLEKLEKDKNSAMKYKELRDELILRKTELATKRKENAEKEIIATKNSIASYDKEKMELEVLLEKLKKESVIAENQLKELEDKIADLGGEEAEELRNKISELRAENKKAIELINYSKDNIRNLKEGNIKLSSELNMIEKELKRHEKEKEKLKKDLDEKCKLLLELEKEYNDLNALIGKTNKDAYSIQKTLAEMKINFESSQVKLHEKKLENDRINEKIMRVKIDIANLEENIGTYEFSLKDIDWQLKELKKETKISTTSLKELQEKLFQKKNNERKLSEQLRELEQIVNKLFREYQRIKAERDVKLETERGYTRAVDKILEARDKGELRGIYGTIAELADVKKEYETALTIAAGGRMQAIVVETDENGEEAINFLKKHRLGRATFLPLNRMIKGQPRGKALLVAKDQKAVGFAIDLMKFDEKYRNAFWYVFADTVVVKDLETARKYIGGVRLATLDGELIEPSGAMIGGSLEKISLKFGATESDLEKISKELQSATLHRDSLTNELTQIRKEIDKLTEELRNYSLKDTTSSAKIGELELKYKEYSIKLEQLTVELPAKKKELESAEKESESIQNEIKELENKIVDLEKRKEDIGKLLLKATTQELATKSKDLQDAINNLNNEINRLKSEIETTNTNLCLINDRKREKEESLANNEKQIIEHKKKIEENEKAKQKNEEQLNSLIKVEQSLSGELKDLQKKRDEAYKKSTDLKNEIDKISGKLETINDLILNVQRRIPDLETTVAELMVELQTYNIKIEKVSKSIDELKTIISNCEMEMGRLGEVNMKAIEDYEIQDKRKRELDEEVKLLIEQKENLTTLVDELKKKKKDGLMKVFVPINENFKQIFSQLSNGGKGELLLENEENPFEGGLIIRAVPKEQKLRKVESLSGGEKSLTALSLIFAIQQYLPSPFYVLDEVDMFLDAINAENVAKMIRQNSNFAQFIMISLRKVTLREADHVYGVTKNQNGISEVIGNVNVSKLNEEYLKEKEEIKEEVVV